MSTVDTVASLFERAIAAEKAARDLYLVFSERFSDPPGIAAFWRSMADDEQDHADRLEEIYATLPPERRDAPVDREMVRKARELEALLPEDVSQHVTTLKEAYWLAHDLENSEVNLIFNFILTQFMDNETQQHFALMQLRDHVSKLTEPSPVRDALWQEG